MIPGSAHFLPILDAPRESRRSGQSALSVQGRDTSLAGRTDAWLLTLLRLAWHPGRHRLCRPSNLDGRELAIDEALESIGTARDGLASPHDLRQG